MKLLIFLVLFSLFFCQNIITSWNYDKVAMYDIQKIKAYLIQEFRGKAFKDPYNIVWNNIVITNITLVDIETNLYDSYLNYNKGLFLLSPNKVTLYINFNYSESTLGYNDTATLELKIGTYKLKIFNFKNNQTVRFSSKMSSPMENYVVPGIKNKDFYAKLQDALFSGFQMQSFLSRYIPEVIDEGLAKYYNEFYSKKKEFKIQTSEFFGKKTYSMRNNKFVYFCEDLIGEYKNGFCYYKGYSNDEGDKTDKTKVPIVNERFAHNTDNLFNIFINKDLVNDILNDNATLEFFKLNPKIYSQKTNNKKLSYDFNVASLNKYFSGLKQLNDNTNFYCQVYIDSIIFNRVNYRVKFNLDNYNFVIKVTSAIDMDISVSKNVRFNLCLKEIKTKTVEVVYDKNNLKVEISNLEGLKKAIDDSFDSDNDKVCLTDEGISLRDYFNKIRNAYIREEGIYLEGDHLYQ